MTSVIIRACCTIYSSVEYNTMWRGSHTPHTAKVKLRYVMVVVSVLGRFGKKIIIVPGLWLNDITLLAITFLVF